MNIPHDHVGMPGEDDEDAWAIVLRGAPQAPLPDEGFGDRVMRQVLALQARQQAGSLTAESALRRLQQRHAQSRRQARWSAGGAVVGLVLGLAVLLLQMPTTNLAAATDQMAVGLLIGIVALAYTLLHGSDAP